MGKRSQKWLSFLLGAAPDVAVIATAAFACKPVVMNVLVCMYVSFVCVCEFERD